MSANNLGGSYSVCSATHFRHNGPVNTLNTTRAPTRRLSPRLIISTFSQGGVNFSTAPVCSCQAKTASGEAGISVCLMNRCFLIVSFSKGHPRNLSRNCQCLKVRALKRQSFDKVLSYLNLDEIWAGKYCHNRRRGVLLKRCNRILMWEGVGFSADKSRMYRVWLRNRQIINSSGLGGR